jgi:hypothetical protein
MAGIFDGIRISQAISLSLGNLRMAESNAMDLIDGV